MSFFDDDENKAGDSFEGQGDSKKRKAADVDDSSLVRKCGTLNAKLQASEGKVAKLEGEAIVFRQRLETSDQNLAASEQRVRDINRRASEAVKAATDRADKAETGHRLEIDRIKNQAKDEIDRLKNEKRDALDGKREAEARMNLAIVAFQNRNPNPNPAAQAAVGADQLRAEAERAVAPLRDLFSDHKIAEYVSVVGDDGFRKLIECLDQNNCSMRPDASVEHIVFRATAVFALLTQLAPKKTEIKELRDLFLALLKGVSRNVVELLTVFVRKDGTAAGLNYHLHRQRYPVKDALFNLMKFVSVVEACIGGAAPLGPNIPSLTGAIHGLAMPPALVLSREPYAVHVVGVDEPDASFVLKSLRGLTLEFAEGETRARERDLFKAFLDPSKSHLVEEQVVGNNDLALALPGARASVSKTVRGLAASSETATIDVAFNVTYQSPQTGVFSSDDLELLPTLVGREAAMKQVKGGAKAKSQAVTLDIVLPGEQDAIDVVVEDLRGIYPELAEDILRKQATMSVSEANKLLNKHSAAGFRAYSVKRLGCIMSPLSGFTRPRRYEPTTVVLKALAV